MNPGTVEPNPDLDAFHAAARRLAEVVKERPPGTRWFLHADADADGISAATVTALALQASGHQFQIRASREKTSATYQSLAKADCDGYVILDKGTSHVAVLTQVAQQTGRPMLIIDHHNIIDEVGPEIHLLNPRAVDLDGSNDASSSTSAVAFALALCGDAAWQWGPIGLVGAIGDWQHMGGWDGWNKRIVEACTEREILQPHIQPAFIGMDLADGLRELGNHETAVKFLQKIHVPNTDVGHLDMEQQTRLLTGVVLQALQDGRPPAELGRLTTTRLGTTRFNDLRHAFRIVDACAREGQSGLAAAYLIGDAVEEAEAVFEHYQRYLTQALDRLRAQGTRRLAHCHVFDVDDPAYTGMVAGLGMTVVLEDKSRPLVVIATRPDGDLQISTRGHDGLVRDGLDLGAACRLAGQAVSREGGGHPVAAGVVIGPDDREAWLQKFDEVLAQQGIP